MGLPVPSVVNDVEPVMSLLPSVVILNPLLHAESAATVPTRINARNDDINDPHTRERDSAIVWTVAVRLISRRLTMN